MIYDNAIKRIFAKIKALSSWTLSEFATALFKANKSYWLRRAELKDDINEEALRRVSIQVTAPYINAGTWLSKNIAKVRRNYQSAFNLSDAEAKRFLKTVNYDRGIMNILRDYLKDAKNFKDDIPYCRCR